MEMLRTLVTFILLLVLSASCVAQDKLLSKKEGKIIGIVDGDTFDILVDGARIRVRMNGIDAPERKQDHYTQSKKTLADLSFGKQAIIVEHGHDRYRRLIADLFVDNQNINYRM